TCSSPAKAAPARNSSPGRFTSTPTAPTSRSWPSTAPPFPKGFSKANCSATKKGPSPAPTASASASSNRPTAAPFSSTKSATWPRPPRPKCSACCKNNSSNAGSGETVTVDVRVLAATNRTLQDMIVAGTFREDLYYRLNGFTVHLPPLRERKDDLPLLVDHFLKM